ncbi:hypothetical protein DFJ77DRAFT_424610, partial [Powellomyces hirtus]
LTAGEECQQAARTFSAFVDAKQGAIPPSYIQSAMGCAICKGNKGVAVLRLKSGEWSAPCAIELEQQGNTIQPGQETVLVFMTENVIHKLVSRALLRLGVTDQFKPGPIHGNEPINPGIDVYGWVRFNGGFTPPDLIASNMVAWFVREAPERHGRWHGESVTWFDVLTNKITVDRSSVGNALYIVLNLAAGSNSNIDPKRKNYANLDALTGIAPSITTTARKTTATPGGGYNSSPQIPQHQHQQQQQQQPQFNEQQYMQQMQALQMQYQPQHQQQQPQYNQQQQNQFQQQQQQQQQQQLLWLQQQQHAAMTAMQQQQGYPSSYGGAAPLQSPQLQQQGSQMPQQPQFSYQQALQQQALAHQQYAQQMQGAGTNKNSYMQGQMGQQGGA